MKFAGDIDVMEPIVTEQNAIPPVTDADRKAAFGNLREYDSRRSRLIICGSAGSAGMATVEDNTSAISAGC